MGGGLERSWSKGEREWEEDWKEVGIMGRGRKEVGINRRVGGVDLERSGNKREREGSMSGKKWK